MNRRTVGVLLVLFSGVCFGTLAVLARLAYAEGLTVSSTLAVRFAVATAALWLVVLARARLSGVDPWPGVRDVGVSVVLGGGGFALVSGLFFWGISLLNAGLATVVFFTYPVFVVAIAAIAIGEAPRRATLAALPLAVGGVAFVAGSAPDAVDPLGVVVCLAAGLCYAAYVTASRAVVRGVDELTLTAYVLPTAGISFVAYGLVTGRLVIPPTETTALLALGLGVVATAVPMLAFFGGLRRVRAGQAGVLGTGEPVVAVALGAAVLDETVTLGTLAGGVLVVAAVILVERSGAGV